MATNAMLPPVKVDPISGKLVPQNTPPPSAAALGLGFQGYASIPENNQKVQQAMTSQFQPLQPNAGMSAANPPPAQPMASSAPPAVAPMASSTPPSIPGMDQARQQLGADQAEYQRLQQSGAAVNQVKNPFLRTLGQIGNIAAPFLLGQGAMAIPGTTAHNLWLQDRAQGRVQGDEGLMQTLGQSAMVPANLAHTQAETQNLLHPRDKFTPLQTDNGYAAFDPSRGTTTPVLDASGQPVATPTKPEDVTVEHQYGQAVYDAIRRGADPSKDPRVVQLQAALQGKTAEKPDTAAQDDQKYEAIISKQKLGQKITPEEGAFAAAYKDRKTLGQQVTNFYADKRGGEKADAATKQATFKAYEPAMDSAERFDIMTQSYEDAIKDPTNQQAMLNLLANHLGMTMGLQKGARLNQAIITEAQKSQPWLAGLKAKFGADGYMTGLTLTPAQMRSMVELAQGRYAGDVKKSRSQSQYLGATDDGPKRDPSAATQRYYFNMAGRDSARARQMMKDDGWTF